MGQYSKQSAIYIGLLLICSTYTLIAPFYPRVAEKKGLPLWLIGVMFALNPLGNILVSPFLGKYLIQLGRKRVIMASYLFTALSMFVLSPIEYFDTTFVIIFSVISRLLGGIGASCLFIAITTVFISDYPDKMQTMIGRMESSIGVGLILGPILGTGLYYINLLAALVVVGGLILLFSPFAWKMLGTFREYKIQEININRYKLFMKPKIFLSVMMDVTFLFTFGFLASILEVHLRTYGISPLFVALCFVLQSTVYLILSLTGGYLFGRFDPRLIMIIGSFFLVLGFLMLGPWSLIFPDSLVVIILGLPVISIGQSMTYMFSIPYMVRSAVDCYDYSEDDILTDVISSFASTGCAFGEILGPIFAGTVSDFLGIENCCLLAGLCMFTFSIIFFIGTGYAKDLFTKKSYKKSSLFINTKVKPEEDILTLRD